MSDKLVSMANQIGSYFIIQPHDEAVTGIAQHIKMYWTPRMRNDILAYVEGGGAQLMPIALAAVEMLRSDAVPIETFFPG